MADLADAVLSSIRTRSDLHRWRAANLHGRQMNEAVDILEAAIPTRPAKEVYNVTQRALASAVTLIARADDSSGIIGDACRRLLRLHPEVAAAAAVPPGKLIEWMMRFQFDSEVDFFQLDPVAYAPALGHSGVTAYRARLADFRSSLGPRPSERDRWTSANSHHWFTLDWNERRLAVFDRDFDAIIRTHAKDQRVAAWLEDTAEAFEEIGEFDLAIDWARRAADFGRDPQSLKAARYWCVLLAEHRPADVLAARLRVFQRWPSASTAGQLHAAAGQAWPNYQDEVSATLASNPRDAVLFALLTLKNPALAWTLAHSLALESDSTWSDLLTAYEVVDPLATLPGHRHLVEQQLVTADARNYQLAARRLANMRRLAAGTPDAGAVDEYVASLREIHRGRPRLQREFDRAGLP